MVWLRAAVSALNIDLDQARVAVAAATAELTASIDECTALRTERDAALLQIREFETATAAASAAHNEEVHMLNVRIGEVSLQLASARSLNEGAAFDQSENLRLIERAAALEAQCSSLQAGLAAAASASAEKDTEIQRLASTLDEERANREVIVSSLQAEHTADLAGVRQQLYAVSERALSASARVSDLEAFEAQSLGEMTTLRTALTELESRLLSSEQQCDASARQNSQLNSQLSSVEASLAACESALVSAVAEREALIAQQQVLQSDSTLADALRSELAEAQHLLSVRDGELRVAEAQVLTVEQAADAASRRCVELDSDATSLKLELESALVLMRAREHEATTANAAHAEAAAALQLLRTQVDSERSQDLTRFEQTKATELSALTAVHAAEVTSLRSQLTSALESLATSETRLQSVTADCARANEDRDSLEASVTSIVEQHQASLTNLAAEMSALSSSLAHARDDIAARDKQLAALQEKLVQGEAVAAELVKARAAVTDLKALLQKAQAAIQQLDDGRANSERRLADMTTECARLVDTHAQQLAVISTHSSVDIATKDEQIAALSEQVLTLVRQAASKPMHPSLSAFVSLRYRRSDGCQHPEATEFRAVLAERDALAAKLLVCCNL